MKVIDRILYKLDDLVRPYVHKVYNISYSSQCFVSRQCHHDPWTMTLELWPLNFDPWTLPPLESWSLLNFKTFIFTQPFLDFQGGAVLGINTFYPRQSSSRDIYQRALVIRKVQRVTTPRPSWINICCYLGACVYNHTVKPKFNHGLSNHLEHLKAKIQKTDLHPDFVYEVVDARHSVVLQSIRAYVSFVIKFSWKTINRVPFMLI